MRCLVAALLVLLPVTAAAADEQVAVYVDPYMGMVKPSDLEYLEGVKGPARSLRILIQRPGSSTSKQQRVTVSGELTKEQVSSLLQVVLGTDDAYWALKKGLDVAVVGDIHRAKVWTSYFCGPPWGSGVSYLYSYEDSRWRYLYMFCSPDKLAGSTSNNRWRGP